MQIRPFICALVCGLCVGGSDAVQAGGTYVLLQTGLFHGDEVTQYRPDKWWGLFPAKDGFQLRACEPEFRTAHDGVMDLPGEATGIEIRVPGTAVPLFIVSGLSNPEPGAVATYASERRFLFPGEQQVYGSDPKSFVTVAALGHAIEDEYGPGIHDYELKLYRRSASGELHSQTLATFDRVSMDGRPELLWAGDLDRDGFPDFLLDLTDHYNLSHLALFLSSEAQEHAIVGFAAEFVTTGC